MQYPSQVEFADVADFETILEASWVTERESPRKESLALYLTAPFFYQILSLFWAKLEGLLPEGRPFISWAVPLRGPAQ